MAPAKDNMTWLSKIDSMNVGKRVTSIICHFRPFHLGFGALPLSKNLPVKTKSYRNTRLYHGIRLFSTTTQARNEQTTPKRSSETPLKDMSEEEQEKLREERAVDTVDVCIVGGGPAALATAIRLKQLDNEIGNEDMRVVVLEKGGDFGSHIVSGAVIEPRALKELLPNSEFLNSGGYDIPLPADLVTPVTDDKMSFLTEKYAFPLPEIPQFSNSKNYIVSLNNVIKYLSEKAEELGVELYPGISVDAVIYREDKKSVLGVATKDMGLSKTGRPKDSFERGMEFHAQMTVFSEGCHGSLTKEVISKFGLREGKCPQTYGLGLKEVWEVKPENFSEGSVVHTLGYPLSYDVYGGGFMYHFGEGLVSVGLVIGLDYSDPYISPYNEFQKMKLHPIYANILDGGNCLSYAARALNEGGFQSVPRLYFPGGVLVGCSAGFVNVPKIKGTHTAMKSGMLAAESIFDAIKDLSRAADSDVVFQEPISLTSYEDKYKDSWVYDELYQVRNARPSFKSPLGLFGGLAHSGFSTMVMKGKEPWTLSHHLTDAAATHDANEYQPIQYPKPDGKITFDLLTSVSRTGTYHNEDEKCHLRIPYQDHRRHAERAFPKYKGIEQRFCPAGVYEYVEDPNEPLGVSFRINSQNCIHCKTCDIKVPTQDIDWRTPEGGEGPNYYMT